MRDFTICIGTTFVFGRDAETKVGDELGAKGVSRVLIHHDGGAYLETSGLLDAVRRSLGRAPPCTTHARWHGLSTRR